MQSIIIFTDGSCKNNGTKNINKKATGGIGIHFPNQELLDISRKCNLTLITNQRTELYAIYIGLLNIHNKLKIKNITIYTDSLYCIKIFTQWIQKWIKNNWFIFKSLNVKTKVKTKVKNKDIIVKIHHFYKLYNIKFIHVKAHTGRLDYMSVNNAKADKLANLGSLK